MNLERTSNYKKCNLVIDDLSTTQIKKMDWLFIIGVIIAPMTNLRIGKIGPGELLCFLWAITKCMKFVIERNIVFDFFVLFYSSMMAGTMICVFVAPQELRAADLITWLYLGIIAFAAFDYFKKKDKEYIFKILETICYGATFWYLFIYLYSIFVSKRYMSIDFWYHGVRFTGGASNPHQLAGFVSALVFFFTGEIIRSQRKMIKLISFFLAMVNLFILLKTKSSTGILAIVTGLLVFLFQVVLLSVNERKRKRTLLILVSVITVLCMAFFVPIYRFLYNWISEDDNGLGRLELFSHIGKTLFTSPIFGLGPGNHSINLREYHNTYLEILAAGGMVGAIAFIRFFKRLIRILNMDSLYFPLVVSLFAFGLAGFIMRRLGFWALIVLVYLITLKEHENEKSSYVC